MMGINGNDLPQEIEALKEVSQNPQPRQWAIDIMEARIQRMTRAFRLSRKVCKPKFYSEREPKIYQIYGSGPRIGIRMI